MLLHRIQIIPIIQNILDNANSKIEVDNYLISIIGTTDTPTGEVYLRSRSDVRQAMQKISHKRYSIDQLLKLLKPFKIEINIPIQHITPYKDTNLIITFPVVIDGIDDDISETVKILLRDRTNSILRFISSGEHVSLGIHDTSKSPAYDSCVTVIPTCNLITNPDEIKQITVESLL
jgi:hypothetical protein